MIKRRRYDPQWIPSLKETRMPDLDDLQSLLRLLFLDENSYITLATVNSPKKSIITRILYFSIKMRQVISYEQFNCSDHEWSNSPVRR
jgi:hypothetical protein